MTSTIVMVTLAGSNLVLLAALVYVINKITPKPSVIVSQSAPQKEEPVVNMEELEKTKRRLAAESEAFSLLMAYNSDVAYGRKGGRA